MKIIINIRKKMLLKTSERKARESREKKMKVEQTSQEFHF